MLYFFNKTVSDSKNILYTLINIYGINIYQSKKICKKLGFNPFQLIKFLNKKQLKILIKHIDKNFLIEHNLKKKKNEDLKKLIDIRSYRGVRHIFGLPVNGQRTHTNANTSKKLKNKNVK